MADKKKTEAPSAEDSLVAKHLQQIANCLAYLVVQMGDLKDKPNRDLIPILANLGFDRNAIWIFRSNRPPIPVQNGHRSERSDAG